MVPAPLANDKIHIDTLRNLNGIIDRDKKQLAEQIQTILKDKNELIETLEDRMRENNTLDDARRALEMENEVLNREK